MMRLLLPLLALGGLAAAGCGSGVSPLRQEEVELQTEVELKAGEGLEEAVQVDSVRWGLGLFNFTVPEAVEIDGSFRIFFRNRADQALEIRYELHFFAADTFLIDRFIPFGQPLRLEPGQVQEAAGEFIIRIGAVEDLRLITIMRVVVRTQVP